MITIIVGVVTIIVLFHYYYTRTYNYWKNRGIPCYQQSNAYAESFRIFRKNIMNELIDQYNAFPDKIAYGIHFFRLPQLLIKDPELIRTICIKDFEHFTNHQGVFFQSDELLGKNLFALNDQKWRDMRSILSPVFTGSKLRGLSELMTECGSQTVEYYVQKLNEQNNDKQLKVDIFDACARFTNDVIASTAFGIKVNSLKDKDNEFFKIGQRVSSFSSWKLYLLGLPAAVREYLGIKIFDNDIYDFFRNMGNETMRIRLEKNIIRPDMIHLLLEARKEQIKRNEEGKIENILTNDEIIAQGVIFFVAGFTNVALAMSFAAYELAVNPEVQEKLYDEIQETEKKTNGKIDYDTIKQMKYMDMVISETLRKWTPASATDRVCNKEFTIETSTDGNIVVKPGMIINIPIAGLHYDPKYFPNPQKFDPERFNETNKSKINPYVYLPFGVGPRICIANRFVLVETKILLYQFLKTFEVVTTDETPIPMVLEFGAAMKPKNNNFGVAFKLRK